MRAFRTGLVPLLLAVCAHAQSGTAVEGIVVSRSTGAGIAGVTVELTAQGKNESAYRAETDARGGFHMIDVAAGDYTVSYDRDGFAGPDDELSQTPVHVPLSGIAISLRKELLPLANVTGRVLDGDGNPVARVSVEWLTYGDGFSRMMTATDDHGRFVFPNITPGNYLLRAAPGSNLELYLKDISKPRKDTSSKPEYVLEPARKMWAPTYYPAAGDRLHATAIRIRGGEDLEGYDIRLQQTAAFRLRGTVVDENGHGAPRALVTLQSDDANAMLTSRPPYAQIDTGDDGSFEFPAVGPGQWRLMAAVKNFVGDRRGFTPVVVTRYDVEDVRIQLSRPFPVLATVERLPPTRDDRPQQFLMLPQDGPEVVYSGKVADGFMHAEAYPGRYRFLGGTLPGYYLDSIMFEHRDVLTEAVELTAAPLPVRFVYRADGGRVHGKVENGGRAYVVIFPQDPVLLSQQLFFQQARCDEAGYFAMDAIRPGDYYAIALGEVDWSAFRSPSADALAKLATRITVERATDSVVDLKAQTWPE
jgi:protocatechuate 3,4-dioxygenase beta subunit